MTALAEGDQVLAMFLKGLEFYQKAELDRAAMQFQNSMQLAPTFAASRLFLGATLAEERHKEAAGLLQSAATQGAKSAKAAGSANPTSRASPARSGSRRANRSWPFSARARRAVAYPRCARAQAARGRLRARRPAPPMPSRRSRRLDANPTDQAALLGALFGTYIRHLNAPQPATPCGRPHQHGEVGEGLCRHQGSNQPLVSAWAKHVQGLK